MSAKKPGSNNRLKIIASVLLLNDFDY